MAWRAGKFWPRKADAGRGWRLASADAAPDEALLRRARTQARAERREIDRFLADCDERLAAAQAARNAIDRLPGCDWAWRPALWRMRMAAAGIAAPASGAALDEETALYHDCRSNEICLRQDRNRGDTDLAPYGVVIDTFGFDGGFLSLAIKLPDEDARSFLKRHVLRLAAGIATERPLDISVRLNVQHGPNTAEMTSRLGPGDRDRVVEFDLAHAGINEKRIGRVWVDLILIAPRMNRVRISDLVITRRSRAEI